MNKKILVIDDDYAIRRSMPLIFEDSGYQVETAESGQLGIEKVQAQAVDLIFLDLKMPKMNGVETLRRIRAFNKEVLVYIFTAFHEEFFTELSAAAKEGLEFEILQKPMDGDYLLELTQNILN